MQIIPFKVNNKEKLNNINIIEFEKKKKKSERSKNK